LGGYAQDLYGVARCRFTNPHSYTKFLTINRLRKETGARIFIEAGTFHGVTAERCASVFERVFTIELDEKLYERAAKRLARKRNIEAIRGDALIALPKVLEDESVSDALIFLDGHFSGGETAHGDLAEPAVEELEVLSKYRNKIKAIVVDDFRCFGTEPGYPSKSDLFKGAEEYFAQHGFNVTVYLDQLIVTRKQFA